MFAQFERSYHDDNEDRIASLVMLPDGGFLAVGSTAANPLGNYDIVLLRLDSLGNLLWSRRHSTASDQSASKIIPLSDGNFAILGSSENTFGDADLLLMKINPMGDKLWSRTYGGSGRDYAAGIVETADGGFAIGGALSIGYWGRRDAYLIRTDSTGALLWDRTYGDSLHDESVYSFIARPGGYVLAGNIDRPNFNGLGGAWMMTTNLQGDSISSAIFHGPVDAANFQSIKSLPDGNLVFTGEFRDKTNYTWPPGDLLLIKTDTLGNALWEKIYGDTLHQIGYDIELTSDGGFAIAGYMGRDPVTWYDMWLVRCDGNGDTLWTQQIGPGNTQVGVDLVICPDGSFVIGGWTHDSSANGTDFYLVKTADSPGSVGMAEEMPNEVGVKVYPNPAQDHFWVDAPADGILELIDGIGRKVMVREVEAGEAVGVSLLGVSKGLYLVRMRVRVQVRAAVGGWDEEQVWVQRLLVE